MGMAGLNVLVYFLFYTSLLLFTFLDIESLLLLFDSLHYVFKLFLSSLR